MKYLKKFNEAIVDYRSEDIDKLMDEILNFPRYKFTLEELVEMGNKYGIEFTDYDTFLNDLPERDKSTAPPRQAPFFGLVNPVTKKPRIVLNMRNITKDFFREVPIGDILKHEQIHVGQHSKRPNYDKPMVEPKNRGEYFADKDEIMAFAFSIAKEVVVVFPKEKTPRSAFDRLQSNKHRFRLYSDILNNVSKDVLKKYNKYIYLYLEDLLKEKEIE